MPLLRQLRRLPMGIVPLLTWPCCAPTLSPQRGFRGAELKREGPHHSSITMAVHRRSKGGHPSLDPPQPPPSPPDQVTTVGKNEIYKRENPIGPFLVHKLLGPRPPPPPPLLILPWSARHLTARVESDGFPPRAFRQTSRLWAQMCE